MGTFLLVVGVLIIGIVCGRAVEGAKRDAGKPTSFTLDLATQQGYDRARLRIDPNKLMSMDEMLLALHRQEGMLGAINDNFSDLHRQAKKYGTDA